MSTARDLAALMAASGPSPAEQLAQTSFRMRLVDQWDIPKGAKVLEIGCGQGDTTAVLADAVGPAGRVLAVDLAEPDYGAPVTIGDSLRHLQDGPLGDRIEVRLGYDVLDPANGFAEDAFDVVVLAHCTWYFESLTRLEQTFRTISTWAPRLCLSEWDLQPRSIDQLGHLLAVLIQGQIEAFKPVSQANVRTPYSRETLRAMLERSNWSIASEALVDASDLADARWEIAACLSASPNEVERFGLPPKLQALVGSQLDVLRRLSGQTEMRSLPSYAVVARRLLQG